MLIIQDVISAFGHPTPPEIITQAPFDLDSSHYERLCQTNDLPAPFDIGCYIDDITYQDTLQPDLFLFLFTVCLRVWQFNLMQAHQSDYRGYMESFSGALAKHAGYKKQLTPSQYDAVNLFMRNVILDKIDQEVDLSIKRCRGVSPYDWIGATVTYGTVYQNLSKLWENWWRVTSKGRAIAMLKYVSGLMYAENENPLFTPWTRGKGGGPPALWNSDGHVYFQSWHQENLVYLRKTLTVDYLRTSITNAASLLEGEIDSTVPSKMVLDINNGDTQARAALRVEELLEYLSQDVGGHYSWKTQ